MLFSNPAKPFIAQRADPWIIRGEDNSYYFTASVPEYDRIILRKAEKLRDLATAEEVTVWRKRETGILSANIWAPELHLLDGKWYIYFAAADTTETKDGLFNHRIYVLENSSPNPLDGFWKEKGSVKTMWESFALDATVFSHNGINYLVWAQKDPSIEGNSNLYIGILENPWTLAEPMTMIAQPEYDWEKIGFLVNEGPAAIIRDSKVFITFSAGATDFNYCVGLLYADLNVDLLDESSWKKLSDPILHTNEKKGIFGPGHNSFTKTEDGEELFVFHARNYKEIEGDPLYDPNRHCYLCRVIWDERDFPDINLDH